MTALVVALAATCVALGLLLVCALVGYSEVVEELRTRLDRAEAENEDLTNELRHQARGNHPAGRGLRDDVPETIRACWENDSVMHICGDPERCEELDTRPPADAWPVSDTPVFDALATERHLAEVRRLPTTRGDDAS